MNEAPLELSHLSKQFDARTLAIDDISLSIPAGSVTGLIGRNGAGKSTLIQCAMGLLKPSAGEARIFSQPSWTLDADAKARLGYVPQTIQLHPWMRVRQLLEYTAAFYPIWNHTLVQGLLCDWDVPADKKIKTLSPGTLQKLAIILALAHEPELLILDEPASALDPAARRQFLTALLEVVSDSRRTILFSTHIVSDLERVADRVVFLSAGRVAFHGGLDELKETVKRLHLSAGRPFESDFDLPGRLRKQIAGHEALVSVRMPTPEVLASLERDYDARIQVEDLSLEDIFLEMQDA
jgi:ABC-2 type transport system ATP-binding protein